MADLVNLTLQVQKSPDWLRFLAVIHGVETDDRFGGWAGHFVDRLSDLNDRDAVFRVIGEDSATGVVLHADLTAEGRDWLADIIAAMPADLAKEFAPQPEGPAKGFAPSDGGAA